jgi:LysR family nitrogen assimilation transcriptional regulator
MNLKQIEYFVRVAEFGSFTRAAEVLDVAQPALSRPVRQLEVELRENLLVRTGRGVQLTEAGKLLLEHGQGLLRQLAATRDVVSGAGGAIRGRVVVGLPPILAAALSTPLVGAFVERMPKASITVREALSYYLEDWLLQGRLDVALIFNPRASPDLIAEPVVDDELVLVAPAGTPLAPVLRLAELATLPMILPARPHTLRRVVDDALDAQGLAPQCAIELDGVAATLSLVADGRGMGLVRRRSVNRFARLDEVSVHAIVEPAPASRLSLVRSSRRPDGVALRVTTGLLRGLADDWAKDASGR